MLALSLAGFLPRTSLARPRSLSPPERCALCWAPINRRSSLPGCSAWLQRAWSFPSGRLRASQPSQSLFQRLPPTWRSPLEVGGRKFAGSVAQLGRAFLVALGLFGLLAVLFPAAAQAQTQ